MRVSLLERSNYYKGLLLLIGQDRTIDHRERELMLYIGKALDFEKRFCEAAIDDLLENKYITGEPIVFSNRDIADCFLSDAIRLALVDEEIHPRELAWLRVVAQANGLAEEWLNAEVTRFREKKSSPDQRTLLHIEQYLQQS